MEFDLGTIIFFAAFLWFLMSEVRPKKKTPQKPPRAPDLRRSPAEPAYRRPLERPGFDTQAEARRLERILRGLDPDPEPLVISLETPPDRPERPRVTFDASAEEAERTRVELARARDRALSAADHAEFDRRIRTPPAVPAERRPRPALRRTRLRDAVIWREILDRPVSLRD